MNTDVYSCVVVWVNVVKLLNKLPFTEMVQGRGKDFSVLGSIHVRVYSKKCQFLRKSLLVELSTYIWNTSLLDFYESGIGVPVCKDLNFWN